MNRPPFAAAFLSFLGTATLFVFQAWADEPPPPDFAEAANDWTIVPGVRVGPINWSTGEASVEALFGEENVVPVDVGTGEGDTEPGTIVFPNDDTRRLHILWRDANTRQHPWWIIVYGENSRWKTASGITIGMSLKALERLNTKPFRLLGFGHDGSGIVTHCGDGVLTELGYPIPVRDGIEAIGCKLSASLSPYGGSREGARKRELLGRVSGDSEFSSGHPAMQALNPRIDRMTVFIDVPAVPVIGSPKPFTIVAFGDSTTAPRAIDGIPLRVYAGVLRDRLAKWNLPVHVINAGVGGNSTADARVRFEEDVLAHEPNLAIIQFGLNDSCIDVWDGKDKPRVPREAYVENLRYFVDTLHARGCHVVLMTANPMRWTAPLLKLYGKPPFDVNDPWGFNLTNREYAEAVRGLAKDLGVPLVDVYQRFLDYSAQPGQAAEDLLLDGMHPNNKGHAMIADWLLDDTVPVIRAR